jgi:hypothetical protein
MLVNAFHKICNKTSSKRCFPDPELHKEMKTIYNGIIKFACFIDFFARMLIFN